MIRVALRRGEPETIYIEFDKVPLEKEESFRCSPAATISFENARQIAKDLHAGCVKGQIEGRNWYRQAGA